MWCQGARDPAVLISIEPYLEILAHQFLPRQEREADPILARIQLPGMWECGGGGGALLPSFSPQANRERVDKERGEGC